MFTSRAGEQLALFPTTVNMLGTQFTREDKRDVVLSIGILPMTTSCDGRALKIESSKGASKT